MAATEAYRLKANNTTDGGAGGYLSPFSVAAKALGLDEAHVPESLTISREQLRNFLTIILRGASFDETWYLAAYPDIDDAIARGVVSSARDHFVNHGYIEGRFPERAKVDEQWYKEKYPDVAEGLELGEIVSCQQHFDTHGRMEGRLPYPT